MILKMKLGPVRASIVLRHRWEEGDSITNWTAAQMRKEWNLGIWAKRYQVVGPVRRGGDRQSTIKQTFNKENLVNAWMIGLSLIVCKVWLDFSFRPTFGIKI